MRPFNSNPLPALLVLTGLAFTLTACAYGVMAVRRLDPAREVVNSRAGVWWEDFLDRQGPVLLAVELGVMAVVAAAVMASPRRRRVPQTDSGDSHGSASRDEQQQKQTPETENTSARS